MKKLVLILTLSIFIVCLSAIQAEVLPAVKKAEKAVSKDVWRYGWINGAEKVFRNRPGYKFNGKIGGTCFVELAKNETEGFQIVLRAKKDIKNVKFVASEFKAGNGGVIKKSQLRLAPVGYVNTVNALKKKKHDWDGHWYNTDDQYQGWYPDPILSFLTKFDLHKNVWQPIWVDVQAPADQPAGLYKGFITVTGDDAPVLKIPVSIRIWNFAIPTQRNFPNTFTWRDRELILYKKYREYSDSEWAKFNQYCHGKLKVEDLGDGAAKKLYDIRKQTIDMLIKHGVFPDNIYRHFPPEISSLKDWVSRGMTCFNIIHIPNLPASDKSETYPANQTVRIMKTLDEIVPKLKKEGLLDKGYIYAFDEIKRPNDFKAAIDILSKVKKKYPDIPIMTTTLDHTYGEKSKLAPYIDIWVPQTNFYVKSTQKNEKARKAGENIWWYLCNYPYSPFANWLIEYTAAEYRLSMGFMPYKFNPQGFLYYQVNRWFVYKTIKDEKGKNKKIAPTYPPIQTGPLTNGAPYTWMPIGAGDGMIIYPGPDETLPTIRLKNIRDGAEDYEYLYLLAKLVKDVEQGKRKAPDGWLKQATEALRVSDNLVKSMTEFTKSGHQIVKERRHIAELIEQALSK